MQQLAAAQIKQTLQPASFFRAFSFFWVAAEHFELKTRSLEHLAERTDENRRRLQGALTKSCCQVGQLPATFSLYRKSQKHAHLVWSHSDLMKTHILYSLFACPIVLIMTGGLLKCYIGDLWFLFSIVSVCCSIDVGLINSQRGRKYKTLACMLCVDKFLNNRTSPMLI